MALSARTIALLAGGEDKEVEYKTKVKQEFNDILVSFANGEGGICIFGVEDDQDENGKHIGKIVGIELSDRIRGQIQGRADQTLDRIDIEIESEIADDGKGIYIVTVKEGTSKPYCTGGGRYLVRRDGQNCPITPTMMESFMRNRISSSSDFRKQFMLDEFRSIREVLQMAMNKCRSNVPPLGKWSQFGWEKDQSLKMLVDNMNTADEELTGHLNEFIRLSNEFWDFYWDAAKSVPQDKAFGPRRDDITAAFLERGGRAFKQGLEETYKKIGERMNLLLS